MKKKIIDVFLMALLLTVTVGSVVSCKDTEEDNYADLNGKLESVSDAVNAQVSGLEERVKALETARETFETEIANLRSELGNATDDATRNTIYGRIASLEAVVSNINTSITEINNTLTEHGNDLDALTGRIEIVEGQISAAVDLAARVSANEDAIAALQALIDADKVKIWEDNIATATENAAAAVARAKMDSARVDSLEDVLGDDFSAFKEAVAAGLMNADGTWKSLQDVLDEQLDLVKGSYDGTLADVVAAYQTADQELADKITAVNARVDSLANVTDNLNCRLGLLESLINKLVTSVIVQGTENPVYGSFSLPLGITSNVLAAYYGTKVYDFEFPSSRPSYYAFGTDRTVLTDEDLNILIGDAERVKPGDDSRIISRDGQPGNAGTLYLTLNPNTADLTGSVATLVNSQDVMSGVRLASLKRSDKVLDFGYTRAANNGFYEAQATVGLDEVDGVTPRISYEDLRGLKDEIRDAYHAIRNNGNVDVAGLVSSVYGICSSILDANAVKFAWTDGEGKEHATYSKYELAATAVKPLGYAFAKDLEVDRVPGLDQVENIIGGIFDDIRDALPEFDTEGLKIEIGEIEFDPISVGTIKTTVTVEDPDGNPVLDDNGKPMSVTVDITNEVQEAFDKAIGSIQGDLSDFVADLNSQIGQLNDLIDQLNQINDLGNTIDDIEDKILDYLNRANNVAIKFINNANELLQPMILAQTGESFVVLSSSKDAPTLFNAATYTDGLNLYATSYTTEILAPAYKKLVGVTNVFKGDASAQGGDDECEDALNAVKDASTSCGMYQILDGDRANVQLKGMKKDYVYEIAYTAVDYRGQIVAKKLYVKLVDKK